MLSDSLLDLVCCPACLGDSVLDASNGEARCARCGAAYAWREGVLDLNPAPSEGAQKEMDAHRLLESTWLERAPLEIRDKISGESGMKVMLSMPRCPFPEVAAAIPDLGRLHDIADDFFEWLDQLELQPGQVVAEIGAHIGWCSAHLARRKARVVATDISPQLAMAGAYAEHGARFERCYMDMMTLPFRPASLDLVVAVAAIHHADDLERLFRACHRALKPGGRCAFFSEPVAGVGDAHAKEIFGAAEKALGVQEHIYTIEEYFSAARAAGFTPSVVVQRSILRDAKRKYSIARALWLAALRAGPGRWGFVERYVYPWMLRFYPKIPFPNFALVLQKPA